MNTMPPPTALEMLVARMDHFEERIERELRTIAQLQWRTVAGIIAILLGMVAFLAVHYVLPSEPSEPLTIMTPYHMEGTLP